MNSRVALTPSLLLLATVWACSEPTNPNAVLEPDTSPEAARHSGSGSPGIQLLVAGGSAYAINRSGDVVGSFTTASGATHAFLWTDDKGLRDLGVLRGADYSVANGINDNGDVVGVSATGNGEFHAVLWRKAHKIRDLGGFGTTMAEAMGINDNGKVVGCATDAAYNEHAFAWTKRGGAQNLGTLGGPSACATSVNGNGVVAGYSTNAGHFIHAVIFRDGAVQDLGTADNGQQSWGYAINAGELVAGRNQTYNTYHTFVWKNGTARSFDPVVPGLSQAWGVDSFGHVVGENTIGMRGVPHAFIWSSGSGGRDLGTAGGSSSTARAINDRGQVAGSSTTANGQSYAVRWNAAY